MNSLPGKWEICDEYADRTVSSDLARVIERKLNQGWDFLLHVPRSSMKYDFVYFKRWVPLTIAQMQEQPDPEYNRGRAAML